MGLGLSVTSQQNKTNPGRSPLSVMPTFRQTEALLSECFPPSETLMSGASKATFATLLPLAMAALHGFDKDSLFGAD